MGKKNNRSRSDAEHYKSIIQKQKSEIRNLRKQLARTNKRVNVYEETIELGEEPEISEELEETIEASNCNAPGCKGSLNSADLGVRWLITCSHCKYRKSVKK